MRTLLFLFALAPMLCFGASSTIHDLPNRATNATTSYMIWDDSTANYNQTFGQLRLTLSTNRTFYDGLTVAGDGATDGSVKLWNAAGTFGVTFAIDSGLSADTNLFFPSILHSSVENNIFTNLTVNNITNTYSYVTNQYVTTNFTQNSYVTNITIIQSLNQSTNLWDGPTNNLPMNKMEQYYLTYTPCSITNLSSLPLSTESANVILTITNAANTNITLYLPHAGMIPERTASVTISNASEGVISVRYRPQSKTNAVFRLF